MGGLRQKLQTRLSRCNRGIQVTPASTLFFPDRDQSELPRLNGAMQGGKAKACLHDDATALITVARKPVNATVEGGGSVGTKLMVWCGEGRMPVPFTLYPDGDVHRITVFGLN